VPFCQLCTRKNKCKRFVVIHGVQDNPGDNDKEHVEKLCETELNLKPGINTCKRLGKVIPGKVRPMLVSVHSDQQASAVIASARNLRKSNNSYVREHDVYQPKFDESPGSSGLSGPLSTATGQGSS